MDKLLKKAILQQGQALITLLFFTVIGVTVTSAAVVILFLNSRSVTAQQQGELAYQIAESGAENALLRVLRTPTSYIGETMDVGSGSAEITVNGNGTVASPYVIVSTGTTGTFQRQVEIQAKYQDNLLEVTSHKEIFN